MVVLRRFVQVVVTAGLLVGVLVASRGGEEAPSDSGEVLRDGFETGAPTWQREYTDATVNLQAHDRSVRAAHGGRLSEHFQFESASGNQFFVSYATPRVPVNDDLSISLFVRADRGGRRCLRGLFFPRTSTRRRALHRS